ncbi:hypothetical protein CTTA_4437 [Comamonas testosteroni]|uniref:Uncharacterized protein n=1 Tax=Comamonas testosteroni TaxID=285 RepID=A0A5A7MIC3_COMTE|nr:hypothetical protein [Comamonas testosteroni]GEQ77432.1 hypothetical protein CTTA_4437 [Comamonas testosteroni]
MKSMGLGEIIAIAAAIAAFLSAVAAFMTMRIQHRDKQKEVLCNQAIQCLERAYAYLMPEGANAPVAVRLAWLSAARQLMTYLMLKKKLADTGAFEQAAFFEVCIANEAHWRQQFYDAIPDTFFNNVGIGLVQPIQDRGQPDLEPISVAVILSFCGMPEDQEDTINHVDIPKRIRQISLRFITLRERYLAQEEALKRIIETYRRND